MAFRFGQGVDQGEDPELAKARQGREAQMERLGVMLDARRAAESREAKQIGKEQREGTMRWGDEAAKGASAGSAFGPWGTLIGGVAGTAKGQMGAYNKRREEGQDVMGALGNTLFDVKGSIPSTGAATGAASTMGPALAGYQSRNAKQKTGAEDARAKLEAMRGGGQAPPPASPPPPPPPTSQKAIDWMATQPSGVPGRPLQGSSGGRLSQEELDRMSPASSFRNTQSRIRAAKG